MHGVGNDTVASLIAERLKSGLVHPGNPEANQQPFAIHLPVFRTTGAPPEVVDQVDTTAKLLGQAIVHLIEESGNSIVATEKLDELTVADDDGGDTGRTIPVHCRCDRKYQTPLLLLTLRSDGRVVTDAKQLIKGLSDREVTCPHLRKR